MEDRLMEALNRLLRLVEMTDKGRKTIQEGLVQVKSHSSWMGSEPCPWPDCNHHVEMRNWMVANTDTGKSVLVPQMVLHYAEVDHHISYTDFSRTDQATLVAIML